MRATDQMAKVCREHQFFRYVAGMTQSRGPLRDTSHWVWDAAVQTKVLKRHLLASAGLLSLTVASSAASAADITVLPRAPVAIWSWSGLYIGGHVGYGWGRDPFTDFIFGGKAPASGITLSGINSKGSVWGFHAGANWQSGAWVGGLEIDLSGTNIKGSSSVSASFTEPPRASV